MLISCKECSNSTNGNAEFCSGSCRTKFFNRQIKRKYPVGYDAKSSLYKIWKAMRLRCYYPSHKGYKNYGARGIIVCPEWRQDYGSFMTWALEKGFRDGLSIERADNSGNYEPSNCTWIPKSEQHHNRRNNLEVVEAFGEKKTVAEWARDCRSRVSYKMLWRRLRAGKSPELAISTPFRGLDDRSKVVYSEETRRLIADAKKRRPNQKDKITGRFI